MEENEFNYINAIPLIDVMLVLLTITLTTATFISQGAIRVNLPTTSVQLEKEPTVVELTLTKDKRIYIDDKEITKDGLSQALASYDKTNDAIQIRADKSLTIDDLTQVLGVVQESGFSKMAIQTEINALH